MKKSIVLPIVLAVISAGLAVLAYIMLPEQVVMQFSIGSSDKSMMPKLLAVLIPTALGIGGAVASMLNKGNEKAAGKSLIVSVVGIGLCIVMMVVNSLI